MKILYYAPSIAEFPDFSHSLIFPAEDVSETEFVCERQGKLLPHLGS
jgi:hypothetical protein